MKVAVFVVMLVPCVGGLWGAARLWRNRAPGLHTELRGWAWSQESWRAFVRQLPVGSVSFLFATATYLFAIVIGEGDEEGFTADIGLVLGLLWFGTGTLVASVFLFNRPRWLVPPHLREEPSFIEERRR